MDEQVFNKDGNVNKYTKLDDILKLNISDSLKEEFGKKFNKQVYYGKKDSCYIGKLVGLEVNEKLSSLFYMVNSGGKIRYIPYGRSITLLN